MDLRYNAVGPRGAEALAALRAAPALTHLSLTLRYCMVGLAGAGALARLSESARPHPSAHLPVSPPELVTELAAAPMKLLYTGMFSVVMFAAFMARSVRRCEMVTCAHAAVSTSGTPSPFGLQRTSPPGFTLQERPPPSVWQPMEHHLGISSKYCAFEKVFRQHPLCQWRIPGTPCRVL